jgi:cell division protein FtsQ
MSWVRHASIKRNVSNDLEIELVEEKVVAYWNDNGFITDHGAVLLVDERPVVENIPSFYGEDHEEVISIYQLVDRELFSGMKPVRSIAVNERKTVNVELVNGSELIMNIDGVDKQIERWNKIAMLQMRGDVNLVKQADLRYSNGAAVSWRDSVAQLDTVKSGDH